MIPPDGSDDLHVWAGNRTCIAEGAAPIPLDVGAALSDVGFPKCGGA
ncbi:MAG: hypothetical protein JO263_07065 [Candidatus Eremiobacteraeota bacterium]|nr:hypothetical protein [Candidatus Eremiobacteraeota bacterium]